MLHLARAISPPARRLRRFLNVHEYISMDLMNQYGIPTPQGRVATTSQHAQEVATEMLQGRRGELCVQ
jgi:succinyl-CoA synthetase beta subunit